MIEPLILVVVLAIIIQFLVDVTKEIAGGAVMRCIKPPLWSLAYGILFAILFGIDLFAALGFATAYPVVTHIFTGFIVSAGASPVHELLAKIRETRGDGA